MLKNKISGFIGFCWLAVMSTSCLPTLVKKEANKNLPSVYTNVQDTANTANIKWRKFFKDPYLIALIDTALKNNQELNIIKQEINVAQNEIKARKGAYLPFLNLIGAAGAEKVSRFTRYGAVDANGNNEIQSGQSVPAFLPDYLVAANVSWQLDVWKQLRNAKNAAVYRYLASQEGKNFMVTRLISEIAFSYNELLALDNQLEIVKANIEIQKNALNLISLEKIAGQVTELAVLRFQAEVRKNQSRQFFIEQKIIETQNTINFLVGRFPTPIERNSTSFYEIQLDTLQGGIPSQLLENRPDVKQAELELIASKLDIKVAKANFYPTVNLNAAIGFEAFNPAFLVTAPQSILFNMIGSLVTPLVNRNAIKANYLSSNARQIKAAYNFERIILRAFTEVIIQRANISNLDKSYDFKLQQVEALNKSINISIKLFKSARADYVEVLMTQRDAIESKMELVETRKQQLNSRVKMYQVLGGGWK